MLGSGDSSGVVLLASVLKPVDDTRMHGKFAPTLLERPGVAVHIAGRASWARPPAAGAEARLHQHSLFDGTRLSLGRLAAQWRYWRLLRRLRPAVVIVHAPELLPLTLLWQALGKGRKYLYDIRENYALNIATQQVYQGLTRRLLAACLRRIETLTARRAAGLTLAEASYADELPYLRQLPAGHIVVLENKYQPAPGEALPTQPRQLPPPHEPLRLLYSGTISELNGVWEAIALAEKLRWAWPGGVRLTIIGFCQRPDLLARLQEKTAAHPEWLTLIGGPKLVPHTAIVAQISESHLGLLLYRPHPSTERCRPTKLFEYLAHGLPILSTPNALWEGLLQAHGAGFAVDFQPPIDGPALVARLRHAAFYPHGIPAEAQWAVEGKKLWHLLDTVI